MYKNAKCFDKGYILLKETNNCYILPDPVKIMSEFNMKKVNFL